MISENATSVLYRPLKLLRSLTCKSAPFKLLMFYSIGTQNQATKERLPTLAGDLDDEKGVLHEDGDGLGIAGLEEDAGGDHAEDGVDVGADDGQAGQQLVQVVRLPEAEGQLLELDEAAEAAEGGQGQDGDLGSREDPEHLLAELRGVLKCVDTY